jgi:hypothetical protein
MKKQNTDNKLAFHKASITELNDTSLNNVHGGSLLSLSVFLTSLLVSVIVDNLD